MVALTLRKPLREHNGFFVLEKSPTIAYYLSTSFLFSFLKRPFTLPTHSTAVLYVTVSPKARTALACQRNPPERGCRFTQHSTTYRFHATTFVSSTTNTHKKNSKQICGYCATDCALEWFENATEEHTASRKHEKTNAYLKPDPKQRATEPTFRNSPTYETNCTRNNCRVLDIFCPRTLTQVANVAQ